MKITSKYTLAPALLATFLMACGGTTVDQSGKNRSNNDELPAPDAPADLVGPPSDPDFRVEATGAQCSLDSDCAGDEACTQGGRCINITGEVDASAVLQAELDELESAVGPGVPYKLPDNASLLLTDHDGDGVALRFETPVIFDGAGSLITVQNDIIGFQVAPTAARSSFRDMRFNPSQPSGQNDNDTIGIDVKAHGVRLDHIYFWYLGTGVRAYSELADGSHLDLNNQQWSRLVFRGVKKYSTDLRGEVSHGVMTGLESVGSAGFYDDSRYGNTYLAPTMEGTHTRSADYMSNESFHTVVGTYLEGGDPLPPTHSPNDLHVGGNSQSRVQGPAERVGGRHTMLTFRDPDSGMEVRLPGDGEAALSWRHPDEGDWWSLRYLLNQYNWAFTHDPSGSSPLRWTSNEHPSGPANLN